MPISISRVFKQKNGNICSFEFGEHVHTEREKINTQKSNNFSYQEAVDANFHQQSL